MYRLTLDLYPGGAGGDFLLERCRSREDKGGVIEIRVSISRLRIAKNGIKIRC